MTFLELNKRLYDKLSPLTMTNGALVLLSLWAFLEASVWFVIPDFLLLILCILYPKNYKKFFVFTLLFSILGIIAYFTFVSNYTVLSGEILLNTPFINQKMLDSINSLYTGKGVSVVLRQTTTVIPVKVWTYQAVVHHFNLFLYLFFVAISRAIRMFIISLIFAFIGKKYRNTLRNYSSILLLAYVLIFFIVLFYVT